MEGYHQELDEAGEFYYEGNDDEWNDDDDSYFSDYEN
jgi:hypothetical protein